MESQQNPVEMRYENFLDPPILINWIKNQKDKTTLFFTGKTNYGKTEVLISVLIKEKYNPLFIRDINGLKNLREDHSAIVLDDIQWSDISRQVKIHLLDKSRSSEIRVLYSTVTIKAHGNSQQ